MKIGHEAKAPFAISSRQRGFLPAVATLWVVLSSGLLAQSLADAHPGNTTLTLPNRAPETGFVTERLFDLTFPKPVAIVTPPGETNRLFVVEQAGIISVVSNLSAPTRSVFLDLTKQVVYGGEQGLLGLAFHPRYRENGFFYIFYTTRTRTALGEGLHDRLSRFTRSKDDGNRADPESEMPIITQFDRAANHNGGDLRFGPEGYLYVTLGDEGGGNDSFKNSQRLDKNFFAGVLRLDVDMKPGNLLPNPHPASSGNYRIPKDNPFVGRSRWQGSNLDPAALRTEFWAVGLRNPWRITYDGPSATWYAADVGQNLYESIHVLTAGGNYGWNFIEGKHPGPRRDKSLEPLTLPIFEYPHGSSRLTGNCVTGGVVYRGHRFPALQGAYIFGDYVTGNVWSLRRGPSNPAKVEWIADQKGVSAFGTDPRNGDVLLCDHYQSAIKRLAFRENNGPPMPQTLSATGAFKDLSVLEPNDGVMPYSLNVPFWSDHALKRRWFSVPNPKAVMAFSTHGNWTFPNGTVWVKHFDMEMVRGDASSSRRLETRFLVKIPGGVYGLTYKWDRDGKEARLVGEAGEEETLSITDHGKALAQTWRYPGRTECLTCHTPQGGYALGFSTGQLNRDPDQGNQVLKLMKAGYVSNAVDDVAALPIWSVDERSPLPHRVKSYLAANCAYCHQPGGSAVAFWDGRFSTPLDRSGLLDGPLNDNRGDPRARVVVPGVPEHSALLHAVSVRGGEQMPPVASNVRDEKAVALLTEWIRSLAKPGP